jgi:hypothetical protein
MLQRSAVSSDASLELIGCGLRPLSSLLGIVYCLALFIAWNCLLEFLSLHNVIDAVYRCWSRICIVVCVFLLLWLGVLSW